MKVGSGKMHGLRPCMLSHFSRVGLFVHLGQNESVYTFCHYCDPYSSDIYIVVILITTFIKVISIPQSKLGARN